ncbi:polysaccharide biosynthesis/export family protein [Pasteurellaceae bacterium LIM206]|nr:polysaccharide biosynthesis/export family protein [Pasteurellaceae bacterium LIM206]
MKKLTITLISLALVGCQSLPTSGPSQSKIMEQQQDNKQAVPTVDIVEVNDQVVNGLFEKNQSQSFRTLPAGNSGSNYAGTVEVGDTLDIMIWEAPPAVLFGSVVEDNGSGNSQLTKLPEQMVSKNGKITVPFLGAITVKGRTPEQIQSVIVNGLSHMANKPQAMVRLVKNNSANVTVLRQGNSIRMPLTSGGERVLDAVAAVGGTTEDLRDVSVQLARGNAVKTMALEKLTADPSENIALRSGDVLTLLNSPLSFTALGAVNNNQEIRFSAKGLSLAEGIGRMGGLIDTRSDPKGVFVFRYIPFEQMNLADQAKWKNRGYTKGMDIPVVYRLNLLDAKSMFWLQRFPLQNKDIVYVSNAPLAEFQKFLRIIFSFVSPVTSTTGTVRNY